jgi:hypothetical protein
MRLLRNAYLALMGALAAPPTEGIPLAPRGVAPYESEKNYSLPFIIFSLSIPRQMRRKIVS